MIIYSYRELKAVLDTMTDEQLDCQAQIMLPQFNQDQSVPLHPIIGFDTIHNFVTPLNSEEEQQETRSSVDNKHHPDNFILLVDYNMFAEDGTIGFDLLTGKRIYGTNNVEVEK